MHVYNDGQFKYFDQEAAFLRWDNHINTLVEHEVKSSVWRGYVQGVELYIQYYPDEGLQAHTARHVVVCFTEIGRECRLSNRYNGRLPMLYGFFC